MIDMDALAENVLFLPFLVGVIFMVTAAITRLFPPRKINYLYGYRTASSMKSQERWDFAQRYSSTKMLQAGLFLTLISLVAIPFHISTQLNLGIGIFLMLPSCIFLFLTTERALKNKFPND